MGIGLVQVYSSSFVYATEIFGDGLFFFRRQLFHVFFGVIVLLSVSRIPKDTLKKYGWGIWFVGILLVALTLVPGFGIRAGGATRWLKLPGGFRIEPGELLKVGFCLYLATLVNLKFYDQNGVLKIKKNKEVFLGQRWKWYGLLSILLIPLFLLLRQPDFGTFVLILGVGFGVLFAFGLRLRWLFYIGVVAIPAFYYLVMRVPYRRDRVLAFLDPWSDPEQKGFQIIQSMLSFSSGKLTGAGLGQGQGKLFFLPEAHTDFTLAVLGEETGFLGFTLLMILYGFGIVKGFQLSLKVKEIFSKTLALGLTLSLTFNILVNIGVVLGMLPTKGLTLPFLSYGGSSMLMMCILFGLLMRIEHENNSLDQDAFEQGDDIKKHKPVDLGKSVKFRF